MRRKLLPLLLAGSMLLLSGCQLAQPEVESAEEDRFCGFYVVPYPQEQEGTIQDDFYNNPGLTVYGTDSLQINGMGTLDIDREVLFAEEKADGHSLFFPGMQEGYSLFSYTYVSENGDVVNSVQSNMAPGEEGMQIKVTDEGEESSISGVIYCGPPVDAAENWDELHTGVIWLAYRVWQMADGRIYLDGSGNSYSNVAGMSFREDHSSSYSENGKTVKTETVTVKVSVRSAPRLERLTVYQYSTDNVLLCTDNVSLNGDIETLNCLSETAWVVVESVSADGVTHAAYDLTEEGISYPVVLLDDAGVGIYTELQITA